MPAPRPEAPTIIKQTIVVATPKASPSPSLPRVPGGSTLRLAVNFLGNNPGHVLVTAGELVLAAEVVEWTPTHATFQMPSVGILAATEARIDVVMPDGGVRRSVRVLLTPPRDLEILDTDTPVARAARRISGPLQPTNTGGLGIE